MGHGLTSLHLECRPSGAYHMSKYPRNIIFAKERAPAAAGKTPTKLIHLTKSQERHFCLKKHRLRKPGRSHQADTHGSPYLCAYMNNIYIEHTHTYLLHKKKNINYTENRESRPHMKNADLTGKYNVKVNFFMKIMKWSHGQYSHFACSTLFQTWKKARVSTQNVSIQNLARSYNFRLKNRFCKSMGKLFPHLVGVFRTHLEPPICHKNLKNNI